ncbi:hypothetical protein DICPUDRAFT_53882 [Dictyostelium purpureum]|uniref:O-acyltransferase n=1 Tax=Dictyostelium purpureum TaxID=5786 RepID=F0ZEP9_DICPU|nr:uncharacterized protein DICPUDRAFT_53882 [Dictyostelium purpureum]EGC37565.1 hypothetical protein DICPUDRAFT_53882 [Dictyostelium purpureum]|eukprot:XP_003285891.1 hypothetical protein DICPUDRAFT_53882 [Dictyostelium purpureum]
MSSTTTISNNRNLNSHKKTKSVIENEKYYNSDQVVVINPKTYGRKFTISKAYLDLKDPPGTKPSLHKYIHKNRILIFTLILLYIALDERNHGINKLVHHISLLSVIFINPFELLKGLIAMHSISFLIPLVNFLYHKKKVSIFNKKAKLLCCYGFIQMLVGLSAIYLIFSHKYPMGTTFYLGLVTIVIEWKAHSYFIVTNYESLHRKNMTPEEKEEDDHLKRSQIQYQIDYTTLYQYFYDYFVFIFTPTLIYDQYFEVKKFSQTVPNETLTTRIFEFLKELYSSFAVMITIHYIHVEYIFPPLVENPDFYAYLKIVIPAEITFHLQYYLLYHCVLSLLADLTNFKDRLSFYDNYWDAETSKQILSRWSKPVHSWLYRHILSDLRSFFKFSNVLCVFATMVFSGFFHEILVISITRDVCVPWATLSLIGCGVFIVLEAKFQNFSKSKIYHTIVKIFLFLGHGLFYFSYYYFCFKSYDVYGFNK